MRIRTGLAAALTWAFMAAAAVNLQGLYVRMETEKVPVARLASNLERQLQSTPKDPDVHLQLARLYAMAYSMNTDQLAATREGRPWFGHEPGLLPPRPSPDAAAADRNAEIRGFLDTALDHYRQALALDPANLRARIGFAWALEESGDRTAGIAEYRRVIAEAWPKEEQAKRGQLGERFFTQEAATRLIPLLDPERDAEEIEELQKRAGRLRALPRPVTPIVIPLRDGATLRDLIEPHAHVPFDADGSGLEREWTWITPDAGWLVYDATGEGHITSALQLFGNVTFWLFWRDGYDALSALDDDGDGAVKGNELRYLAIWRDEDADGRSSRREVRPLADYDIVSLSTRKAPGDGVLTAAIAPNGVSFRDGRTRHTYDVILTVCE